MAAPILKVGYCDKCGGSMINLAKGIECEDCGNTTVKKEK